MITHLYARNFGSIEKSLQIELGAFTVLGGPDGSGKGALVDVLRFLAECASGAFGQRWSKGGRANSGPPRDGSGAGLDMRLGVGVSNAHGHGFWLMHLGPGDQAGELRVNNESAAWWKRLPSIQSTTPSLKAIFDAESDQVDAAFDRLKGSPKGFSRRSRGTRYALAYRGIAPVAVTGSRLLLPLLSDSPVTPIVDELRRVVLYALPPRVLHTPQKPSPSRRLRATGDNWASVLKALDNERWRSDLVAGLSRLIGVDDVRVSQVGGLLVPELRHGVDPDGRERWLTASQEAERTLRIAAMVTALSQDPALGLAGFEHIESFADADALSTLLDYTREIATRRQILLTTEHSSLLEVLPNGDRYAVERRDGSTVAVRLEAGVSGDASPVTR